MNKYFAYKGNYSLEEAKSKKIDNTKFHARSDEIVIKRCNRLWKENNYKLYTFKNFNDNNTFILIK